MKSNIFIPNKCKVGFNIREDTYTGKLGYCIAFDGKKWRKESSWKSWRHKEGQKYSRRVEVDGQYKWEEFYYDDSVKPIEFDNVPTEGFVLNKKAGGYSTAWNHRATYCRVYDPRGFEFEISISNLLYILDNTNSEVGKGLSGSFVYGWDGKDLVLIPENAPEYKEMIAFTQLQSKKVSSKDLIIGATYKHKNNEELIYLGRFDYYDTKYDRRNNKYVDIIKKNQYWFKTKSGFTQYSSLTSIGECISEECVSNYAELMDELETKKEYSPYDESLFQYELLTDEEAKGEFYIKNVYTKEGYSINIDDNRYNTWYRVYKNDETPLDKYNNYKKHCETIIKSYLDKGEKPNWYIENKLKNLEIKNDVIILGGKTVVIPEDINIYNYLINNQLAYKQINYLKNGKKASN